jgi:DNA-binding SARP family transcriptional activator/class 3 adenylate cyclase
MAMEVDRLDFAILGPLEVRRGGEQVELGARQQSLLGALLLNANKVVPVERLIAELWGDAPPETATNTLQVHVSQLRKILEPGTRGAARALQTRPPGYAATIGEEQLDLYRFESLLVQGREAVLADEFEQASELLRAALAIWRGPCLSGVILLGPAQATVAGLDELRLAIQEDLIAVELALGRHVSVVPELEALVAEHPYRESLRGHLMLALYRSGRQADALDAFRRARETLVEELGIEPSRQLQRLEQEILRQDAGLDRPAPSAPPPEPVPAQAKVEAGVEPTERRKTIAVAVSDLVTELGEASAIEPEVVARLTDQALELVRAATARHHGLVYRVAGGRMITVFGAAIAHEDDALRAARASLEAAAALAAAGAGPGSTSEVRLRLRAGIEAGIAIVGRDASGDLSVTGNLVLAAERAAACAGPDEVLVGPVARPLLEGVARFEPPAAGGTDAGFARVAAVGPASPSAARRHDASLVGRANELAELRHAIARASRDRRCLLVTLLGEAGIGKSRLALELARETSAEHVAWGTCRSYGEAVTFAPLADVVEALIGGEPSEAAVAALLAGEEDEAGRVAGVLAGALVGEAVAQTEEVFRAARRLLEVVARGRPLVVVLDDVHWAEPTFLDLIEHVAEWSREAPLLLLCLARPELLEERPSWGSGRVNGSTVLLEPLTEAESEALVDELANGHELAGETRRRIAAFAGGNPFFVEQLLAVVRQEPEYTAELRSPPSIQALLSARLDRLPGGERQLLEHAAVLGAEFATDALRSLLPDSLQETVASELELLTQRRLLRPLETGLRRDDRYAFAHALIQESAYGALSKRQRAVLHARHAEWLERDTSQTPAELDELIGHQLEQAYLCWHELGEQKRELGERAAARLLSAGRRAGGIGDMPKAVSLFTAVTHLLEPDDPNRAEALAELGEALRDVGDFPRAEETLEEAIAAADRSGDAAAEARALAVRWQIRLQTDPGVSFQEATRAIEATIDRLEQLGHERGLAKAWISLAEVPYLRGQAATSEQALERGLALARAAGDTRTEAMAMSGLVGAAMFGPMPVPAAIQRCEEMLARTNGADRVAAAALRALAGLSAMGGRFEDAWLYVERDRAIVHDLGLRILASSSTLIAGQVGLLAGEPQRAESELRRGYETLAEIGDRNGLATVAAGLAEALLAQGRDKEALAIAATGRECAAPEDVPAQVGWRGPAAAALARRGQLDEGERLAREAVELAERTDFLDLHAGVLLNLAEVLRLGGKPSEAATAAQGAATLYAAKGNLVALARAQATAKAASLAPA